MRPNEDEVRGKLDKVSGEVKERVGRATGDLDLEERGANQHDAGTLEEGVGKARRKVGEAVSDLGKKLGR